MPTSARSTALLATVRRGRRPRRPAPPHLLLPIRRDRCLHRPAYRAPCNPSVGAGFSCPPSCQPIPGHCCGRQSGHFLETASLLLPPAALRRFPRPREGQSPSPTHHQEMLCVHCCNVSLPGPFSNRPWQSVPRSRFFPHSTIRSAVPARSSAIRSLGSHTTWYPIFPAETATWERLSAVS